MNAAQLAQSAYAGAKAPLRAPRAMEYDAFAQATAALRMADRNGGQAYTDLVSAIHENRTLWQFVASSVSDKDNKLPAETKASLFYLAEFTEAQSKAILRGAGDIGALIDINTAVMKGLGQQTEVAS